MQVSIQNGFADAERPKVAAMYWRAFGRKLGRLMGPGKKGQALIARVADPAFAISARAPNGRLVGLAGFKTADGSLVGGDMSDLAAVYGWLGALWRAPLLSVLERPIQPGVLLMDGIMVAEGARGQGVGSQLMEAVKAEARRRGCAQVRLDVIDSNPRARDLYDRLGFEVVGIQRTGPLARLFRFESATQMRFRL